MAAVEEDSKRAQDLFIHIYHILKYVKHQGIGQGNDESDINHVLKSWVHFHYKKEIRCGMCNEKGVAVGYCKDCERPWFIDRLCFTFHRKISTFESHRLIDFSKDGCNFSIRDFSPNKCCNSHKDTDLDLYCNNCKITFCKKCEDHKHVYNHNVHSITHLYTLLDNIHDTKSQMEGIIRTQKNLSACKRVQLTTMIMYIDVALGIVNTYADISDVPTPPHNERLLKNESSANMASVKCKAVIRKLAEVQRDIFSVFTSHQSQDVVREEDGPLPTVASDDDSQFIWTESLVATRPSENNATLHTEIDKMADVKAPVQVKEDNKCQAKPIENEVACLQQAIQCNIHLESFLDLHTNGNDSSRNEQRRSEMVSNEQIPSHLKTSVCCASKFEIDQHHKPFDPMYQGYVSLTARLQTYDNWPLSLPPRILANAGFFYTGLNNDVRCFWCDLVLRNWESGEDPWVEHARWFPRCAFIRQTRGDEFVDMVQNAFSQKKHHRSSSLSAVEMKVVEMGFSINEVEKAYAFLEKSGRQCINVDVLLERLWNENENDRYCIGSENANANSRNSCSTFASQQLGSEEENSRHNEAKMLCKVCSENVVALAFIPCGHRAACVECAPALKKCPICRSIIKAVN